MSEFTINQEVQESNPSYPDLAEDGEYESGVKKVYEEAAEKLKKVGEDNAQDIFSHLKRQLVRLQEMQAWLTKNKDRIALMEVEQRQSENFAPYKFLERMNIAEQQLSKLSQVYQSMEPFGGNYEELETLIPKFLLNFSMVGEMCEYASGQQAIEK